MLLLLGHVRGKKKDASIEIIILFLFPLHSVKNIYNLSFSKKNPNCSSERDHDWILEFLYVGMTAPREWQFSPSNDAMWLVGENGSCFPTCAQNMQSVTRQTTSKIKQKQNRKKKKPSANVTGLFWLHLPNTGNQKLHSLSGVFVQTMFRKKRNFNPLDIITVCKCWPFLMIWKHRAKAPADCNTLFLKWELKCYRQLEESLEFPWNEVLNETWSDWQVGSPSHWAFSVLLWRFMQRGERYTPLFFRKIKSQCI